MCFPDERTEVLSPTVASHIVLTTCSPGGSSHCTAKELLGLFIYSREPVCNGSEHVCCPNHCGFLAESVQSHDARVEIPTR